MRTGTPGDVRPARVAALVVLVAAGLLAGCSRTGTERVSQEASSPAAAPPGTSGESIYDLDLELTDADGRTLPLSELRDTLRVAAMMYANCSSVCPRITEDMKGIERQLAAQGVTGVSFVMFSLDPGRDSPEALRGFAREHALDRSRWRLFSTSEEGVRDLAAVLGVKYKKEGSEFAHTASIILLDRGGVIRHQQWGLNADASDLVAAIRAAR